MVQQNYRVSSTKVLLRMRIGNKLLDREHSRGTTQMEWLRQFIDADCNSIGTTCLSQLRMRLKVSDQRSSSFLPPTIQTRCRMFHSRWLPMAGIMTHQSWSTQSVSECGSRGVLRREAPRRFLAFPSRHSKPPRHVRSYLRHLWGYLGHFTGLSIRGPHTTPSFLSTTG
jgi:hypothetical protein